MTTNTFIRAAALAACLLLAPTLALPYGGSGGGGGGGGGDVGRSRSPGSGATIGSTSTYADQCAGVTEQAPAPAQTTLRDDPDLPDRLSPKAERLGLILDCMMDNGDLTYEQARHVLFIFIIGDYRRNPQSWESRSASAAGHDGDASSAQDPARYSHNPENRQSLADAMGTTPQAPAAPAQDPARYTHNPENRQSLADAVGTTPQAPAAPTPTTTRARYANAINNHKSAVAAYNAYVQAHGQPAAAGMPQDEEHASLLVSTLAWDETMDVPDSVRQMAMVMESQVASGTISPRDAYTLLMAQVAKTGARRAR